MDKGKWTCGTTYPSWKRGDFATTAQVLSSNDAEAIEAIETTETTEPTGTPTMEDKLRSVIDTQQIILYEITLIKSFISAYNPWLTFTNTTASQRNLNATNTATATASSSLSFPSFTSEMINTSATAQSSGQLDQTVFQSLTFQPQALPLTTNGYTDTNMLDANNFLTSTPIPDNQPDNQPDAATNTQPKPLEFPDVETVDTLYRLRSKYNFCVALLNCIYPNIKDDLYNTNVNGKGRGKRALNSCVVSYLKHTFFEYYKTPDERHKDTEWKKCTKSINTHLSKYVTKPKNKLKNNNK